MGWDVSNYDPHILDPLGDALDRLCESDFVIPDDFMRTYTSAVQRGATAEIAGMRMDPPEANERYVALGTVIAVPVLLAFRRLAQEVASLERFREYPLS